MKNHPLKWSGICFIAGALILSQAWALKQLVAPDNRGLALSLMVVMSVPFAGRLLSSRMYKKYVVTFLFMLFCIVAAIAVEEFLQVVAPELGLIAGLIVMMAGGVTGLVVYWVYRFLASFLNQ